MGESESTHEAPNGFPLNVYSGRMLIAAIVGLVCFVALSAQGAAQSSGPSVPGYFLTLTAIPGDRFSSVTFTSRYYFTIVDRRIDCDLDTLLHTHPY